MPQNKETVCPDFKGDWCHDGTCLRVGNLPDHTCTSKEQEDRAMLEKSNWRIHVLELSSSRCPRLNCHAVQKRSL